RQRGCQNRMGFFLHIPWPPRRLLGTLPGARALVESMFAYDLIGFHTEEWLESFCDYARQDMGAVIEDGVARLGDRSVELIACPIGIDAAAFADMSKSVNARLAYRRMRDSAD